MINRAQQPMYKGKNYALQVPLNSDMILQVGVLVLMYETLIKIYKTCIQSGHINNLTQFAADV